MSRKPFQHKIERSNSSHAILETASRKRKAAKIQALLDEATEFSKATVLDIGTGSGDIAYELAKSAAKVVSVDIVDERKQKTGYKFKLTKDENLPFGDNFFDIVITNHVVEHTPNQKKHLSEVMRVLKPGGYVYIATPNKYWLTDPHYKLPFISWLPRKVSNFYLRLFQKTDWDIYPLSSRKLKKLFGSKAEVTNALPILLTTKAVQKLDMWKSAAVIARFAPKSLLNLSQYISPTLIHIVRKQ
ncbi:MAG: class I SAM-dependent methyltransferase [Candidatus Saccharibacteria bacterium]|nr:class I SAM-dependent methyltransferase [Candidatus Saccharibacteria bacterium]